MPEFVFTFDPTAPVGEKLAPWLREEIAAVSPATLNPGDVDTDKLQDGAVTEAKIADGAVSSEKLASGAVKTTNIEAGAVSTNRIADNAVTAAKAGVGVVKSYDKDGVPLAMHVLPLSQTDHAAIASPDPSAIYLVLEE